VKNTTWHTIRTTTIFIPLRTYDHIGPQKLICGTHLVLSPLCIVVDVIMQELWFFNSPSIM
jgi:hypothetical protein